MRKLITFTILSVLVLTNSGCDRNNGRDTKSDYDPLAKAIASIGKTVNFEAVVPPQCYTKTNGVANPCWTCHTSPNAPNYLVDWPLQEEYAFSDFALINKWTNLFVDRSEAISRISDKQVFEYIREDNYNGLFKELEFRKDYPGWKPDLNFDMGFDNEGFAKDGSWWRAIRYKPFLGTFWPTNGSTDDVMIRLPREFWTDESANISREVYKINLAILEAAINCSPKSVLKDCERIVEPIDETQAGVDLNRDGNISGKINLIRGLPSHYAGAAKKVEVKRYLYPKGVEFLHTVRYVDPESSNLLSKRMKEVRYSKKVMWLDNWAIIRKYEREHNEKDEGILPKFSGSPLVGLRNDFGWQLQGFIEDRHGRLRLQTEEEHRFCMGCHSAIGVSVDQTFTLARKVPGLEGWRHQDPRGINDVPQAGHTEPEILTYFKRVAGGDEFRANDEILNRFFPDGVLNETEVRRAAKGGDKDITSLIVPSRERALLLNKAYMTLVKEQTFELGRDTVIRPTVNVFKNIENGSTELNSAGRVFRDGSLWLDWD